MGLSKPALFEKRQRVRQLHSHVLNTAVQPCVNPAVSFNNPAPAEISCLLQPCLVSLLVGSISVRALKKLKRIHAISNRDSRFISEMAYEALVTPECNGAVAFHASAVLVQLNRQPEVARQRSNNLEHPCQQPSLAATSDAAGEATNHCCTPLLL